MASYVNPRDTDRLEKCWEKAALKKYRHWQKKEEKLQKAVTLKFTISAPQRLGYQRLVSFDAGNARGVHTRSTRLPNLKFNELGSGTPGDFFART